VSSSGTTVLVVDDESGMRKVVRDALELMAR